MTKITIPSVNPSSSPSLRVPISGPEMHMSHEPRRCRRSDVYVATGDAPELPVATYTSLLQTGSWRAQRSNPVTLPGCTTRHTRASKVAGLLRRCAPRNDEFHDGWTLYQAATGTEEEQNIYNQFSPDFFDRVIIDVGRNPRAHGNERASIHPRGFRHRVRRKATPSVLPELRWNPHDGAVRGPPYLNPIYTCSLRRGISDGFLKPYSVVRIGIDKDLDGWRPEIGQTDKYGTTIEDREYNDSDYDRHLIQEKRTPIQMS